MPEPTGLSAVTENRVVQEVRQALTAGVPRPIWWEIPGERPKRLDYTEACRTCRFVRSSAGNRRSCQRRFLRGLEEARRKGEGIQFICPIQRYTVCMPLVTGGQTRGYLAMCHSEQPVPRQSLKLAQAALRSALREQERSEELKTLSDTIQPRCVALSTIHTIHRLISSTLNLEELLPRVARLCCQVLRAQSCAIWLVDRDKRRLVPRAFVHLNGRSKPPGGRFPGGAGARWVAQVAATAKASLTGKRMVVPLVEEDCIGVLMVQRIGAGNSFSALDQEILTTLAEQAVVAIRNAQMYETQERVTWGTIRSLSAILDGMDTRSSGRVSRRELLAGVALAIAEELHLPAAQQKSIQYAALLHDAGRVGIPEGILKKPSKLEPAEYAQIREHTIRGASLLEPLEILEPAVPIILHHHERYDGTGYPKGLRRESIPLGARILAVANAFEAMVYDRPYRRALSVKEAAQEIASHAGTQFDPKVVQAFLKLVRNGRLESLLAADSGRASAGGG